MELAAPFAPGERIEGKMREPGYEGFPFEAWCEEIVPESRFSFRWHPYGIDPDYDYSAEPTTLVMFELEEIDGGTRLTVTESGGMVRTALVDGPPENFCKPAVDTLFRSAASVYGGRAAALVLTGMGADGLEGCRLLAAKGARILVQDEATSVVWGMPGAVATAGLAHDVLALEHVAGKLAGLLG